MFQEVLDWIQGWLEVADRSDYPCHILLLSFEALVQDEKAFIQKILDFYAIPTERFTYPFSASQRNGSWFGNTPDIYSPYYTLRCGRTDEWRDVLTSAQIQKTSQLIPASWFERFGWPRQ